MAEKLASRLDINKEKLYKIIRKRETDSSIVVRPGIAIVSHIIKGRDKFEMLLVRSRKGIIISSDADPIHAFFMIVASSDQQNFYFHSLMWVVQISEEIDFEKEWLDAHDIEELRGILLTAWDRREVI